jgi:hypothetical protein
MDSLINQTVRLKAAKPPGNATRFLEKLEFVTAETKSAKSDFFVSKIG